MIKSPTTPDGPRQVWKRRLFQLLSHPLTHIAMGLGVLLLDFFTGPYLMFPMLFVIPVVLASWFCNARWGYALAIVLPLGRFLIVHLVENLFTLPINVVNALIRIAVLALLVFFVARTARQSREIKQLQGLLPICMYCKRIRDESEKWQHFETYISQHSQADFSHGLCPECARKHFGDVLAAGEEKPGPNVGI